LKKLSKSPQLFNKPTYHIKKKSDLECVKQIQNCKSSSNILRKRMDRKSTRHTSNYLVILLVKKGKLPEGGQLKQVGARIRIHDHLLHCFRNIMNVTAYVRYRIWDLDDDGSSSFALNIIKTLSGYSSGEKTFISGHVRYRIRIQNYDDFTTNTLNTINISLGQQWRKKGILLERFKFTPAEARIRTLEIF